MVANNEAKKYRIWHIHPGPRITMVEAPNAINHGTDDSCKLGVLCGPCRLQLNDYSLKDPNEAVLQGLSHRRGLRNAQTSSLNGCHLCSLVVQRLSPAHVPEDIVDPSDARCIVVQPLSITDPADPSFYRIELMLYLVDKEPNKDLSFAVHCYSGSSSMGDNLDYLATSSMWIYCAKTQSARYPESIHEPAALSFSTASKATFQLVSSWIKECTDTHETCQHFSSTPGSTGVSVRPEYVIEVSPSLTREQDLSLRLVETAKLPADIRWVTLSHCWGLNPIFRTLKGNRDAMLVSIPLIELPKTFRDAAQVTHSLGYSYIWIDSLCIIQDCDKHWVQESAIMGDIYHQSVFTIAASGAADGAVGCFRTRNSLCFQDLSYPIHPNNGETWWIWIPRAYMKAAEWESLPEEPLHTRGWVLQERLLSPRIIYYGTSHVSFECCTDSSTESDSFPPTSTREGIKSNFWRIVAKQSKDSASAARLAQMNALLRAVGEPDEDEDNIVQELWSLVQTYTSCFLTKGEDKLVAIGGIFKMVESLTGLTNIAGLWRETLLYDLLWSRVFGSRVKASSRPKEYRAPTWSWASLDGEVAHRYPFNELLGRWRATLVDAGVSGRKANGQIQGGWARLRGPVRRATLTCDANDVDGFAGMLEGENGEEITRFYSDVEVVADREVWLFLIAQFPKRPPKQLGLYGSELMELDSRWETPGYEETVSSWDTRVGLVVEPMEVEASHGDEPIKWVRIGMFELEQLPTARFNSLFIEDEDREMEIYLV